MRHSPLRLKVGVLLAVTSVLPLAVVTVLLLHRERTVARAANIALLEARVDQVGNTMEALHRGFHAAAQGTARDAEVIAFCAAAPSARSGSLPSVFEHLSGVGGADPAVRAVGLVDLDGVVIASTEPVLVGTSLAYREYVQRALRGEDALSDLYLSVPATGRVPSFAHAVPVRASDGRIVGVLLLWIRAQVVWDVMRDANGLAGPGSFFVLFDRHGIRIGHSANESLLFHPAAPLSDEAATATLATRRFQERTAELIGAVEPFPLDQIAGRERAAFRRWSPTNRAWNLAVSRQLTSLGWTLVTHVPEHAVEVRLGSLLLDFLPAGLVGLFLVLLGSAAFLRNLVQPIRQLAGAATALEQGKLPAGRRFAGAAVRDELGDLARAFESMAATLADRDRALRERNRELERLLAEVTERRRLEQQMQVELQQAQKLEAVGRLAAGIAHEINTPIQFIGDNTRFLQEAFGAVCELLHVQQEALASAGVPEEVRRRLREAAEEVELDYLLEEGPRSVERTLSGLQRVATIVRAMKEFAHPDQREMIATDLNRALLATLEVARNEYKYVADVQPSWGELPLVTCHPGELNQVFLNVIVNAAHAIADRSGEAGRRGVIRVETRREGDDVLVAISDDGGGIPEAIRDKIFEPFFTTKEIGRGTGQGLTLARNIVVKHGGALTFESRVGEGTTFLIRVPIAQAAAKAA